MGNIIRWTGWSSGDWTSRIREAKGGESGERSGCSTSSRWRRTRRGIYKPWCKQLSSSSTVICPILLQTLCPLSHPLPSRSPFSSSSAKIARLSGRQIATDVKKSAALPALSCERNVTPSRSTTVSSRRIKERDIGRTSRFPQIPIQSLLFRIQGLHHGISHQPLSPRASRIVHFRFLHTPHFPIRLSPSPFSPQTIRRSTNADSDRQSTGKSPPGPLRCKLVPSSSGRWRPRN